MMSFKDFKTDSYSLDEVIQKSDFDEQLEQDFNTIDGNFCRLEINCQCLINARRFLNNISSE
ncbi:hypothetical protein COO91_08857 [Nostoc flagelliforme CCNUN1]|uniref:Uncharacterized protein n=1 Tax=Nostoc flagelliforme CCNUN1 TaxID=2038116 RepID=A0A2K8T4X4_9NOSO|nr:hypothetical protein COO91_08857 [Nostoc flagelliforme CCNUN1]